MSAPVFCTECERHVDRSEFDFMAGLCDSCLSALPMFDDRSTPKRNLSRLAGALNDHTARMYPCHAARKALADWLWRTLHNATHAGQAALGYRKCALCDGLTGNRFRPMSHHQPRRTR